MSFFRSREPRPATDKIENVVGPSANFSGHLKSEGGVRIDGSFDGTIETESNVIIGEKAKVDADVSGFNVTVAGSIQGNVEAVRLEILSTGRVLGDVCADSLLIEEGGVFHGRSLMEEAEELTLKEERKPPEKPAVEPAVESPDTEPPTEEPATESAAESSEIEPVAEELAAELGAGPPAENSAAGHVEDDKQDQPESVEQDMSQDSDRPPEPVSESSPEPVSESSEERQDRPEKQIQKNPPPENGKTDDET